MANNFIENLGKDGAFFTEGIKLTSSDGSIIITKNPDGSIDLKTKGA